MKALVAPLIAHLLPVPLAPVPLARCGIARMADADADKKLTPPEVSPHLVNVARTLKENADEEAEIERRQADEWELKQKMGTLFGDDDYLYARDDLVGSIDSAALLQRDEDEGDWPANLESDPEAASMLWVDELSCIGCQWCADVARSTFKMAHEDHEFGTARVVQQGGDNAETVDEAIASCPADCIQRCTRKELTVLEEYRRRGHLHELMSKWQTRRLVSQGEGGGSFAAPHWRDPLVHRGWMKGDKFVKTSRLRMEDPLLHGSGEKTDFVLWATADSDGASPPSAEFEPPTPPPAAPVKAAQRAEAEKLPWD